MHCLPLDEIAVLLWQGGCGLSDHGRQQPDEDASTNSRGRRIARTWFFAFSFIFRPWFKVVAIGSTAVIGIVLLLYGLKALGAVAKVLSEQE